MKGIGNGEKWSVLGMGKVEVHGLRRKVVFHMGWGFGRELGEGG